MSRSHTSTSRTTALTVVLMVATVTLAVLATPAAIGVARAATRLVKDPYGLNSIACPSARQCTAVDSRAEVTFNPQTGRRRRHGLRTIDTHRGGGLLAVVCPSLSWCTAVDRRADVVSFDPQTGRRVGRRISRIDFRGPTAMACPSTGQCTVVDNYGATVTFDPRSGRRSAPGRVRLDAGNGGFGTIACPSLIQCTAADGNGNELTFDPQTQRVGRPGLTALAAGSLATVACPSATQCTAVGIDQESTFDPQTGMPLGVADQGIDPNGQGYNDLSCPTLSQCTAIDARSRAVTFNPLTGVRHPRRFRAIKGYRHDPAYAIACPTTAQCTTISGGDEVTFDPKG